MDRYNKYQTNKYTHAHTSTLHTQRVVASTWLGDHHGRPTAPTNSLHKLHMARYQVHQLQITNKWKANKITFGHENILSQL